MFRSFACLFDGFTRTWFTSATVKQEASELARDRSYPEMPRPDSIATGDDETPRTDNRFEKEEKMDLYLVYFVNIPLCPARANTPCPKQYEPSEAQQRAKMMRLQILSRRYAID